MKINTLTRLFIFLALNSAQAVANDGASDAGKELFTLRCASCHNVNKKTVGPALAGITERRSPEWIVSFVQSSQTLIKAGDPQATALYKEFNNLAMPEHKDLSASDIAGIVNYITASTKTGVVEKTPFARPGKKQPAWVPLSISDNGGFFISYILLVGLLILVLLFAVDASEMKNNRKPV